MKSKTNQRTRYKARGVSLPAHMEKAALARATAADIGFSKYIQRLISIDLERGLIKPLELLPK